MAKPSDIEDPAFRAAVEEAERLMDEGDYTRASRRCAETYLQLLDRRPDLIPPPGMGLGFGFGLSGEFSHRFLGLLGLFNLAQCFIEARDRQCNRLPPFVVFLFKR